MADSEKRLERFLKREDRKDRFEQKLGIDRKMTRLRDERASRTIDRVERSRKNNS